MITDLTGRTEKHSENFIKDEINKSRGCNAQHKEYS